MAGAPDLQALVQAHGGYDKIPSEAWTEYDAAIATWRRDMINTLLDERYLSSLNFMKMQARNKMHQARKKVRARR